MDRRRPNQAPWSPKQRTSRPHRSLRRSSFLRAELRRSGEPFQATPGELAQVLVRSTGGTTTELDRLAATGHITRVPNPKDRRSNIVRLTGGRRLTDTALQDHLGAEQRSSTASTRPTPNPASTCCGPSPAACATGRSRKPLGTSNPHCTRTGRVAFRVGSQATPGDLGGVCCSSFLRDLVKVGLGGSVALVDPDACGTRA